METKYSLSVENETDAIIDELMKTQKAQNDPQKVLEEMERERREMEEMFTIKADEVERLREKDVLSKLLLLLGIDILFPGEPLACS